MAFLERPIPATEDDPALSRQLRDAIDLLERLAADWRLLDRLPAAERARFHRAVAGLTTPEARAGRKRARQEERERRIARIGQEEAVLHETGIRALRRRPAVTTPNCFPPPAAMADALPAAAQRDGDKSGPAADASAGERRCYVCKEIYSELHHFYDQLCPACADVNFAARTELADLRGRVALLTGGRVKIGYQAGLKLLRSGAHLIVTTRFPRNAAARYAAEADFGDWGHRLEIVGLDLRHTPSVEAFCRDLAASRDRLDFIVNNACQTVRRPPEFYAHMMAEERAAVRELPAHARRLLRERGQPQADRALDRAGRRRLPLRRTLAGAAAAGGTAVAP